MKKKYLIVIGGPTASGKTAFAIRVAQQFKTEILSCDSRQFYREMSIGTAKPSPEERAAVPHHFIDSLSIETPYSVGDFERDALKLLEDLYLRHQIVVLTGGSGLYQKALCEGLDEFPDVPAHVRESVIRLYETSGLEALQAELKQCDPDYYEQVDRNNPQRLIRAISVYQASGKPFSSFRKAQTEKRPFIPVYLFLNPDRDVLYERINRRVTDMVAAGLVEEARNLYTRRHLDALQTVGYQELFDYFDQKIGLEEAIELIQQHTRNYAKRQLTWARRDGFWKYIRPDETDMALKALEQDLITA
ncbi:MAG: tRNA (adenosine(37)-N6)-dimethylallyltransferase MiaA [Saprospiraceae bacterium]|nr:tRNA (adenosine(37)-N6)-dimethylallyltransferase MiaA [Saprospiraceae bacterium]